MRNISRIDCKNILTFWQVQLIGWQNNFSFWWHWHTHTHTHTQKGFEAWLKCLRWFIAFCKRATKFWCPRKRLWQWHPQFKESQGRFKNEPKQLRKTVIHYINKWDIQICFENWANEDVKGCKRLKASILTHTLTFTFLWIYE